MGNVSASAALWVGVATAVFTGCGEDAPSGGGGSGAASATTTTTGPDNAGAACEIADDCYEGIDHASLQGDVMCMDRVRGGYCTHMCTDDADCCAVADECAEGIAEVCSPFESTGMNMCFLSCEKDDLVPAPGQTSAVDEQEYCQRAAGRDFVCRSSGGGSSNRKVCVPGDCGVGAACTTNTDCAAGLSCVAAFLGGYCTQEGCKENADCPGGSSCVSEGTTTYCYRACASETDCSFFRGSNLGAACSASVTFAQAGTTGSVCVPP